MQAQLAVQYRWTDSGYRYSIQIKAPAEFGAFTVPFGSGAYNHLTAEFVRSDDWQIWETAFYHIGTVQPVRIIDLDEIDVLRLERFRV